MSTTSDSGPDRFLPLSEPCLEGNEWKYVKECLDSGWISSVGAFVTRFEENIAGYVGAKHGVATVNGTAALHTALLVAGVEPGDEVLVSTLTFIASANAIRYAGAHPVFIDAEPQYWQMDPDLVSDFLRTRCIWSNGQLKNRSTGRRIKAIMPVHVLGHPVDLDPIYDEAAKFGLRVIEDSAESLGASYQGRRIGATADLACISFNGNKTITCGGGGMIVTNSQADADRARYLTTQAKDDPTEYIHNEVGYNYRMTNVLAAIGLAQLEQLDSHVDRRRKIADYYRSRLAMPGFRWHCDSGKARSTSWLSTVLLDPVQTGVTAVELRNRLAAYQIQTRRLWQPMHQSPAHQGCQVMLNGTADLLFENALSFPSSPSLTGDDLMRVSDRVLDSIPVRMRRAG
jgi:perosamine synthetase